MHKSLALIALAVVLVFVTGAALGGSTPQPSVGGTEAELGCAPTRQALRSSIDGARCRDLARLVFKFDTSAADLQLTLEQLGQTQDALKAQLDSMGDLNEELSIKLQQMMERRSQLMTTLSNILKRISDTQNAIVQNLK